VITEFSMPVLETANIQTRKYFGPSGVSIHNYGAPVDLDLPKLRSVGDMLDLQGAISRYVHVGTPCIVRCMLTR
jgi:hypothetical protein